MSARGDVFPLVNWGDGCCKLKRQGLESIWFGETMTRFRELAFEDLEACVGCETYENCVRCAGLAEIETGDYRGCPSESRRLSRILTEIKDKTRRKGG